MKKKYYFVSLVLLIVILVSGCILPASETTEAIFGKTDALKIEIYPERPHLGQTVNISIKLSETEDPNAKIEIDPSRTSVTISTRMLVITGDIYDESSIDSNGVRPAVITKDKPYTFTYDLNFVFENPEDMIGEYRVSIGRTAIYKINGRSNSIILLTGSPFYIDEISTTYITDSDLKKYYDAIINDNYNLCKDITKNEITKRYRDICFSKAAFATNDSQYCSDIIDQRKHDSCYYKISVNNNEYQSCGNITDSTDRNKCYSTIARSLKSSSVCEKISEQTEKDMCFYNIGDCDSIQTKLTRDSCYKIFKIAYCGDGKCNGNETCSTCIGDCGVCRCGNGICEEGENCSNCTEDCACSAGFECKFNICIKKT